MSNQLPALALPWVFECGHEVILGAYTIEEMTETINNQDGVCPACQLAQRGRMVHGWAVIPGTYYGCPGDVHYPAHVPCSQCTTETRRAA